MRNQCVTLALKGLLWLSYRLPITWVRAAGRGLGWFVYQADGRSRRVTERNVALAYPQLSPESQNRLVREVLRETGALAVEMGHVWRAPWAHTSSLIESSEGSESVQAALASGSGVIVLGPHL
ncbi:bacitracin ABC transporter permease, partial [Luminiphilus sp.]|nr:bacitracin ABC transporter permease [Luminiphilus sp.]